MNEEIMDQARMNVIRTFGTFDEYKESWPAKKQGTAEKHYSKLIDTEIERINSTNKKLTGRSRKEKAVSDVLLESYPGQSVLRKVEIENGEILLQPDTGKKEEVYTGIVPHVLEVHKDIIPSWPARRLLPGKFRVRVNYKLWDQPFTRDLYTGGILAPEKKRKVLVEKGVLDRDGFMLDSEGNRLEYNGCYVKVDVSDIDFITGEMLALSESKAIDQVAVAMKKTGQPVEKWFFFLFLACLGVIALVVFLLSGGTTGWF